MMTGEIRRRTFFIKTWGCQMNVLDGEKMAGVLGDMGMKPVPRMEDADVVLFNTCSVREGPENKVFTELGKLRRLNGRRRLVGLVGCVAQQEKERIFRRAPFVDLVMGPRAVNRLPELIAQAERQRAIDTGFHEDSLVFPYESIARSNSVKAFVTVMQGCNKRCAYCIVPYTRGREAYRPLDSILEEVSGTVERGYTEIELLGQNVNCWKSEEKNFVDLLDAVSSIDGVRRLRFTTSHPGHFPIQAADLMAERDNICPYLHLPVQAGSDKILKAMRRGYTRRRYLDLVGEIRRRIPEIALSTDFIVGFPGETEEDFQDTLEVVREAEYDTIFSFRYSPRPGTAAEKLEPVPRSVAMERHQRLLDLQAVIQERRFRAFVGREVEVLVEGESKKGGQYSGRDPSNKIVNFTCTRPVEVNSVVRVRVTRSAHNSLVGEAVGRRE